MVNSKDLLTKSVYISLIIQIITGIVTFKGMFMNVSKNDKVLIDIITLENVVQVIEAIFYFYIALALSDIDLNLVTPRRYFDWYITTPTMLISTILYMEYQNRKERKEKQIRILEFLKENKTNVIKIVFYNFMMLTFGYLGETNYINKPISIFIGFIFFGLSFENIYTNFVGNNSSNKKLYMFLISIWSLYGVAAVLPTIPKNLSYNVLDIIAKNFYGIFIYYKILEAVN